jgi:hypothetical protein
MNHKGADGLDTNMVLTMNLIVNPTAPIPLRKVPARIARHGSCPRAITLEPISHLATAM